MAPLLLLRCCSAAAAAGGGSFGLWGTDEYGLPFYNFTANQSAAALLVGSYSRVARDSAEPGEQGGGPFAQDPTASMFHIGNDELVLLLSTHGHAQVRQDQGGPKLLNDFNPADNQFGGGVGYLVDSVTGELLLSTYYGSDAAQAYERHFGVGYARRLLKRADGLATEQRLIVPFGTDPVVVSETIVTNGSPRPLQLSYYEVWCGSTWQMAANQGGQRRKFQDENYQATIGTFNTHYGLTLQQLFNGTHGDGAPAEAVAAGASLWDESPPLTFLVNAYEHDVTTETACNADAFYGAKGARHPAFEMACDARPARQSASAMILRRNMSLAAGERVQFSFLYGYVVAGRPNAKSLTTLLADYSYGETRGNWLMVQNGQNWRRNLPQLRFPGSGDGDGDTANALGREVSWNYAMTRQTLTFDNYFNESIIDQGTAYRYGSCPFCGFQGAARDPLQHVLPFIISGDFELVRSVLRYTLKELRAPPPRLPNGTLSTHDYANLPVRRGHSIVCLVDVVRV